MHIRVVPILFFLLRLYEYTALAYQYRRAASNSTLLVEDVDESHIALSGRVELNNVGQSEALLKLGPDIGTETVTEGDANLVVLVKVSLGERGKE